jgi:SAM-dependent methyltransferase
MNIEYLMLRFIRRRLPENLVKTLLRNRLIIKPGLETREPRKAVERYQSLLNEQSITFSGKNVLIFGYGGSLAVAVELLRIGCTHVTVCDLFPPVDNHIDDSLLPEYSQFLEMKADVVKAKPEWITIYHGDIRSVPDSIRLGPFDLVISSSVYEHLEDVDGITAALSKLLKPSGYFVAYIDLRDHYFKYPFEMLCYSTTIWKNWLNPTSNLNRYRIWDYRNIFNRYFKNIQFNILERDLEHFNKVKQRIRREFKSGNESQDAVVSIVVISSQTIWQNERE